MHQLDGPRGLLVLLAFAFVVRLVVLLTVGLGLSDQELLGLGGGDGGGYHQLALSLLDGEGFSHPLFILRPPGLPLVEAAIFWVADNDSPWLILVLNLLASSLTVVATVLLAEAVGVRRRYALLAGFLIAIEPASIYYGVTPLTEPLFTLAVTLVLIAAIRLAKSSNVGARHIAGGTAAVGLLIGAALLLKPLAAGIGLLVVAAFAFKYRRRAPAYTLVLVLPLIFGLAWAANNQRQFDNFTFSNSFSYNVLFLKTPVVLVAAEGGSEEQIRLDLIEELGERRNIDYPPGTEHYDFLTVTDSETLSEMNSLAFETWLDHPTGNIRPTASGAYAVLFRFRDSTPAGVLLAPLRLILYIGAAFGAVLLWRAGWRMAAFLLAGIVSYIVLTNIFALGVGDLRLAMPIYPALAALFAVAVQRLVERRQTAVASSKAGAPIPVQ